MGPHQFGDRAMKAGRHVRSSEQGPENICCQRPGGLAIVDQVAVAAVVAHDNFVHTVAAVYTQEQDFLAEHGGRAAVRGVVGSGALRCGVHGICG